LCEKTPEVSARIGETVLPTYTYARAYQKGAVLERHSDRGACEISLTLNLDADKVWPIYIEHPDHPKGFAAKLNPGDALLYLGCEAEHWRNKFTGTFCTQVFLHYVRSRGPYARCYFDKAR
jgi:hypothetical protein